MLTRGVFRDFYRIIAKAEEEQRNVCTLASSGYQQSRGLPLDLSSPTFRNGCRTHLSSLVINVKILAKHGSHRLAGEYRLLNTKEQPTNSTWVRSTIILFPLPRAFRVHIRLCTAALVIENYSIS